MRKVQFVQTNFKGIDIKETKRNCNNEFQLKNFSFKSNGQGSNQKWSISKKCLGFFLFILLSTFQPAYSQSCIVTGSGCGNVMDWGNDYIPDQYHSTLTINLTFHFMQSTLSESNNFKLDGDGVTGTDGIPGLQEMTGYEVADRIVASINHLINVGNVEFSLAQAAGISAPALPYGYRFRVKDVIFYNQPSTVSISSDPNSINIRMHSTHVQNVQIQTLNSLDWVPFCVTETEDGVGWLNSNHYQFGSAALCSKNLQIQDFWYVYKYEVAQIMKILALEQMAVLDCSESVVQLHESALNWRIAEISRQIWHEIAHCFGLSHTVLAINGQVASTSEEDFVWNPPYSSYYTNLTTYCSDNPPVGDLLDLFNGCHPADSQQNGGGSDCGACDFIPQGCASNYTCSNNLMDYCGATDGRALTPQQLGRFHRTLHAELIDTVHDDYCISDNEFDVVIDEDQSLVWIADRIFKGDITIEGGSQLTVKGHISMAENARIIVKPGAKLIIDGGCISNRCGLLWLGIEVWGNHQLSQSPASNQGFLELKNGATVENARCGVRLGHVENYSPWTYDWSKTGGIVRATNAHFRNNSKDVEFLSYANITSGGNEMPNFSFFRDCSFIVDKPLNNGATTLGARVSMWNVNGVRIGRCKFAIEGDALGFYPIQNRGEGIGTIQSGFTVEGTCNYIPQVGSECHPNDITAQSLSETSGDITPCVFRGFRYGIRANGPDGYSNVNIRNSIFEDNFVGVHLMALEQPSLFRNRFYISDQNYTILNNSFPIEHGAILRGCTGYEVKRNFFEGSSSQIDNHLRVGLWIHDSGDEPNEVYLNDFKDLFGGSIAMGWNRNQLIDERGLEILCGLYQNTLYDVAVVQSSEHQGNIAIMQGRASNDPNDVTAPAGNIFNNINYNNGENDYHIDQNSQWIVYQHHNANSTFNVVPWESHIGVDVFLSPNTPEMISRLQACPKNNRGTGHEERSNVLTHRENAEELMEEYEALVDGGDTQGLLDLIANQANESAALRNELLGISPYLSDPVITAAILRNPAMNQWHLCEVLLANSPLRQDVWDAYESAAPLAPVLHDLLEAYQFEGLSARDRLASDIKAELLSKQRALGHYVRIQLGNEDLLNGAEILELMEGEEIKVRLRKEFAHARHAGDASGAAQKLADYEENPETEVWKQVMQVMLSIDAAGGYAGATEAHIEQLTQLAAAGKYGSVHATAMLENITGDIVEEELHFPSPSTKSLKSAKAKGVKPSLAGVYPNPASGEFYITYVLPMERKSASVLIYDAMGRHIATRDITNGHGILSMDARDFSAGTFVFQLQLEGKTVATEKFVIAK
jgi:hypothetical protein